MVLKEMTSRFSKSLRQTRAVVEDMFRHCAWHNRIETSPFHPLALSSHLRDDDAAEAAKKRGRRRLVSRWASRHSENQKMRGSSSTHQGQASSALPSSLGSKWCVAPRSLSWIPNDCDSYPAGPAKSGSRQLTAQGGRNADEEKNSTSQ